MATPEALRERLTLENRRWNTKNTVVMTGHLQMLPWTQRPFNMVAVSYSEWTNTIMMDYPRPHLIRQGGYYRAEVMLGERQGFRWVAH